MAFPESVLIRAGIFILLTPSTWLYTSSYLRTSQLDNTIHLLCTYISSVATYVAISAQRFKLNYTHFPGSFCAVFCVADSFYQLCVYIAILFWQLASLQE